MSLAANPGFSNKKGEDASIVYLIILDVERMVLVRSKKTTETGSWNSEDLWSWKRKEDKVLYMSPKRTRSSM
jgi:hypothetical protein